MALKQNFLKEDNNIEHTYDIINLSFSVFNLVLFLILLTITLVRVKCNIFFRIVLVFIAYTICFSTRCINYFIHYDKPPNDFDTSFVVLDTLAQVTTAIKLFMIFFFILQLSELRAKMESESIQELKKRLKFEKRKRIIIYIVYISNEATIRICDVLEYENQFFKAMNILECITKIILLLVDLFFTIEMISLVRFYINKQK